MVLTTERGTLAHGETSPVSLLRHTAIQTQRLLLRWSRNPVALLETLIIPCLLLLMLDIVIGGQIQKFSGTDALYGSVPMVAVVGALSGAVASGVMLGRERDAGLLARFWVLPVHRSSGLISRILAEGCRILLGTLVVIVVGHLLGFRFQQGLVPALLFVFIPVLFGLAFATMVTAIAVFTAKATLVESITILTSLLMFFSTGFVPLIAFPQWIQPVVRNQPMSAAVDSMKALSLGGPLARPLTLTFLWSLGAIIVFAVPAVIGYRRASRR
ncbi:ABC-2 type transport system permease protein [Nocardia amikacinitolerans]|uniref:Transport permease protein n=1 Tax=Nocardia amikacinitolerans TaxID=756689 RepID=A0A285LDU8_9NOCA|nr:ABC transporter permease [Nocardia amikacinitolerans]MCP2280349.1 ABC-2 type transport system permease protein [Nocardia amikacinitolerans]MCP2300009.1 ABC-2 type transport system permease protein [Nocardia amikacinitolerans]SNY81571.1 ABC-2 type transport system permease protein [Nocardia amikacinitolerans]